MMKHVLRGPLAAALRCLAGAVGSHGTTEGRMLIISTTFPVPAISVTK